MQILIMQKCFEVATIRKENESQQDKLRRKNLPKDVESWFDGLCQSFVEDPGKWKQEFDDCLQYTEKTGESSVRINCKNKHPGINLNSMKVFDVVENDEWRQLFGCGHLRRKIVQDGHVLNNCYVYMACITEAPAIAGAMDKIGVGVYADCKKSGCTII